MTEVRVHAAFKVADESTFLKEAVKIVEATQVKLHIQSLLLNRLLSEENILHFRRPRLPKCTLSPNKVGCLWPFLSKRSVTEGTDIHIPLNLPFKKCFASLQLFAGLKNCFRQSKGASTTSCTRRQEEERQAVTP